MGRGRPSTKRKLGDIMDDRASSRSATPKPKFSPVTRALSPPLSFDNYMEEYNAGLQHVPDDDYHVKKKKVYDASVC